MSEPRFGDRVRSIYAGETNPRREGFYVQTIYRRGRLNPGRHYRITDGKGDFWETPAESVQPVESAQQNEPNDEPDLTTRIRALAHIAYGYTREGLVLFNKAEARALLSRLSGPTTNPTPNPPQASSSGEQSDEQLAADIARLREQADDERKEAAVGRRYAERIRNGEIPEPICTEEESIANAEASDEMADFYERIIARLSGGQQSVTLEQVREAFDAQLVVDARLPAEVESAFGAYVTQLRDRVIGWLETAGLSGRGSAQ